MQNALALEEEIELIYELECSEPVWPGWIHVVEDEADYASIEVVCDAREPLSDHWFEQPDDVIAALDDVLIEARKPRLMSLMFAVGVVLTVAACIITK